MRGHTKVTKAKSREPLGEAALFEYAVGALARRMRTERELRRLLQPRAEGSEIGGRISSPVPAVDAVDAVVLRLKEMNYLSDARFAADYTRLRKENEKFGRRRVEQDLAAKGVARGLVAAHVGEAYAEVDEPALAREYIARKRMRRPESEKESARTMGQLLRAGFSAAAVWKVLREWGIAVEEFEVEEG
jgi:regulatory protein